MNVLIETACSELGYLKVAELKVIARACLLTVQGRKADIKERLIRFMVEAQTSIPADPLRIKAVQFLIEKAKTGATVTPTYEIIYTALRNGQDLYSLVVPDLSSPARQAPSQPSSDNQTNHEYSSANNISAKQTSAHKPPPLPKTTNGLDVTFKQAPFYKPKRLISKSIIKASKNVHGRGSVQAIFFLSKEEVDLLLNNDKYKLFLYSADHSSPVKINVDIKFPHPLEIKMNNNVIKDNIRGFKSKPGTAKPADVTPFTFISTARQNCLSIIYACTNVNFILCLYVVEVVTPLDLVTKQIAMQPKISKASTLKLLKEMLQEEEDDEMMTTSMILSLQCPISYSRMKYPARSIYCKHLQCFDAQWFLESQKQVPTWVCPVCQKDIKVDDLGICEYVEEILEASNEETEQIELNVDGSWSVIHDDDADLSDGEERKPVIEDMINNGGTNASNNNDRIVISLDSSDEEEEEDRQLIDGLSTRNNALPSTMYLHDPSVEITVPLLNPNRPGVNNAGVISPSTHSNLNNSVIINDQSPQSRVIDVTSNSAQKNNTNTGLTNYGQTLDPQYQSNGNGNGLTQTDNNNIGSSPSPQYNGNFNASPSSWTNNNQQPPDEQFRFPLFANGVETTLNDENSSMPMSSRSANPNFVPENTHLQAPAVLEPLRTDSNADSLLKESHQQRSTVNQRRRAPVSIFIPRKHYSTIIPQKRHASDSSAAAQNEVIDLTSD